MHTSALPRKTKADTECCMRIWDAWRKERIARNESKEDTETDIPLKQLDMKVMKHWLTLLILEVRKQNRTEYPPNTLHHIVCGIMRYLRQNAITVGAKKVNVVHRNTP